MRKVLLGFAALLALAGCAHNTQGHGQIPPKQLSHWAVEQYIKRNLGTVVVCNQGIDFPMRRAGQQFYCNDQHGITRYTVTITNPLNGHYRVS